MARSLPGRGAAGAASEKRKKQIVIGGAVLLVVILVFQFMRLSGGGSPPATPTSAGSTTGTPSAPGTLTAGAGPTFATQPATRRVLDRMPVKDPFVPLIRAGSGGATETAPAEAAPPPASETKTAKPAPTETAETKPATGAPVGFTPETSAPKAAPPPPAAALLTVNGSSQTVGRSKLFPAKAPAFRLVAVTPSSVRIGVAGGSFTGDRETITIRRGQTVTLVNTATGQKYVLRYAAPRASAPQAAAEPAAEPSSEKTTEKTSTEQSSTTPPAEEGDE